LNVVLNVFLVVVCHLSVAGVAIATVTSQGVSAVCCLVVLIKAKEGFSSFKIKYARIYPRDFYEMIKIGVPAGLQGCMFSLSNVLIQSTINALGPAVTNGNGVAAQLDGFVYTAMNAVALSTLAFIGQNLGAGRIERVKKSIAAACGVVVLVGVSLSTIVILLRKPLCGIMAEDEEVLKYAYQRLFVLCGPYFLGGVQEVLCNSLRGLGKSTFAMFVSLFWSCIFRLIWVYLVVPMHPTFVMLDCVYPVSWSFTIVSYVILLIPILKALERKKALDKAEREKCANVASEMAEAVADEAAVESL
jgi:Na+-driven multidrug efflux pump